MKQQLELILRSITRLSVITEGNDVYDGLMPQYDGIHGPKKTIQPAVNDALAGEEVAVMGGYYYGFGNRSIDLGGKSIAVRGITVQRRL